MKLPQAFQTRIKQQWPEEAGDLLDALQAPASISLRLNAGKLPDVSADLESVPWAKHAYYLPERPLFTLDPWWHAGAYYVQEASSMLIETAFKQVFSQSEPLMALDLCGAPGGKSTHLTSLLPEGSVLVSNEVIRARAGVLAENLKKWGRGTHIVTQNDPRDFQALPHQFDLMVVDAPCSGEGMFRKDEGAVGEWSEAHLNLCVDRQRRILMDVWESLKPGGVLFCSTCTFHPGENEENLGWLAEQKELEALSLTFSPEWNIVSRTHNGISGYYCLPHRVRGEGFFLAVIRKKGEANEVSGKKRKRKGKGPELPWKRLSGRATHELPDWLVPDLEGTFIQLRDTFIWLPKALFDCLERMETNFRIVAAGVGIGEVKKKDIRPEPELALFTGLKDAAFPVETLELETAVHYLSRASVETHFPKGWGIVAFEGVNLGFAKQIQNRMNNYWPSEWKIRMQVPADLSDTFLLQKHLP